MFNRNIVSDNDSNQSHTTAVPAAASRLARAMDIDERALTASIWSLGRSVGVPEGLRSIGISEEQIPAIARAAVARNLPSPRPLDYDRLYEALRAAWAGEPPA